MFSSACKYGIKAIVYIGTRSMQGGRVKVGDIAEHVGSPEAFTAKILGALVKHVIVESVKGPYGGFEISEDNMKRIKLSEIVYAIDGDSIYNGCALGLSECSDLEPCPMHDKFVKVRDQLKYMLETTSVYDLAMDLMSGKTTLIRELK